MKNEEWALFYGYAPQELCRCYNGNGTGVKVFDISGNDKIGGEALSYGELDRVFKIAPFQFKGTADMRVRYGGGIKNPQQAFDGFTGGFFSVFFLCEVKDVGY